MEFLGCISTSISQPAFVITKVEPKFLVILNNIREVPFKYVKQLRKVQHVFSPRKLITKSHSQILDDGGEKSETLQIFLTFSTLFLSPGHSMIPIFYKYHTYNNNLILKHILLLHVMILSLQFHIKVRVQLIWWRESDLRTP